MYARIEGGVVAELIEETDVPIKKRFHPAIVATLVALTASQKDQVKLGWTYANRTFSAPPTAPEAAEPAPIRIIRALAFRDRFTAEQQAAIAVAAAQLAATGDGSLAAYQLNQVAASETNLDDPRVVAGVGMLQAGGLITEAEATALLADGTPDEAV